MSSHTTKSHSQAGAPIIVAGAGIGGLCAALQLAHKGAQVLLIEKRTTLTEAGAGIQLSPNASRVLIELGLGAAVARRAVEPKQLTIRRIKDGRILAHMPLGEAARARHGAPYWSILRSDLHTVLLDAARSDPRIQILVGRQIIDCSEKENHAEVQIKNSNSALQTLQTPLLIGADGMWSHLRSLIGEGDPPQFRQFEAWRCVIPQESVPESLRLQEIAAWLGPHAHIVHYPVAGGKEWNLVVIVRSQIETEGWGLPLDRTRLEAFIASFKKTALSDLRSLLKSGENWRSWSLYDALPAFRWSSAHATLLGDAAHPMLPFLAQGGAMAIEDSAILVSELARQPNDTKAALKAYEDKRYPRVRRAMEEARSNGRSFHFRGFTALVRDMLLSQFGAEGLSKRYDWLYGWKPD